MDYLDFDIEVRAGDGHVYPVAARSAVGEAQSAAAFPFTDAELETHLLRLENAILRSAGRRGKALSEEERTVQRLGQQMFEFLLAGELRALYYECQREATHRQQGIRLRLHIQPPLLAMLPWEFLYDPRRKDYVCLDLYTPLVRYLDMAQSIPPLAVPPPLRILGMVASPRDWPALDVAGEMQRVERALHHLSQQGAVELTWVSGQSWRDLQRVMRPGGAPCHIFHFIGHGGVDTAREEGFVLLSDEQGQGQRISATQLGRLLAGQRYVLRLVVLNACEGARGGRTDVFSSSAAALVRSGLPAVLAMQYAITDMAAVEFAQTFYEALAAGLPVDSAVADARNAVNLRNEYSLEWGTPVLYLRAADGRIFEPMPAAPRPKQETPPAPAPAMPDQITSSIPAASQERAPLPALLAGIRAVLATLYPDEPSARRVVADTGLSTARIAFSSQATNNWQAILNEASKTGQVERVLAVALREYSPNQQLQEAVELWRAGRGEESVPASTVEAVVPAGELRVREVAPEPARPAKPALPVEFDWVTIPAGEFLIGSDKWKDETPQHTLNLPTYRIARVPVTVAQFARFTEATGYKTTAEERGSAQVWRRSKWDDVQGANWAHPRGPESDVRQKQEHPVTCVSWHDAVAFCAWAGVRLPSEDEWEKAARGTDARIFPWGNQEPTEELCNFKGNVGDTTEVGRYPKGASPYGLLDMAGNVWEWTMSLWGTDVRKPDFGYPYRADDGRENLDAPDSVLRTFRGGSWYYIEHFVRCAFRDGDYPNFRDVNVGFRVVDNPGNGKLRARLERTQAEQWFGNPPPGSDMLDRPTSSTLAPATGKAPDEPGKPVVAPAAQLFFSYAHKDEELRDQLETHLASLKRQGVISGWHDRQIWPGTEWAGQIDDHIDSAQIILLLVSADFLASDYCYDLEMRRAMSRHDAGLARVIPVILRPCDWQRTPFAKLQALPKDARPITSWANRDEAFLNVTQGIRAALGAQ